MKKGWEYIALSSVCKVQNGFAFNSRLFNDSEKGLPLIRIRDIKRGYSFTYTDESCTDDFFVEDGDMLIGMDGDFNIGEWKGGHALLNQRVCKLIPSEKVLAKFIFYFIPEALQKINDKTAFSTVKHLSSKQVSTILLPNLALSEQRSIVDYLDSAFAKIDAMKANAEKALNEAKALFQASLKEMLEPKEGWEEKTLGEMSEIQSGFAFKSTQFQKSGKYQVIRMGNVRPGLIRYNESPVYIESMDESKIEKALLKVGDMIITQTGSRNKRDYGYSVLIDKDNLLLNQRIARIRVVNTIINKYLLYYSWTDYFRDQYFANEGGTVGQGNVGIDAIKYAVIPCPPLSEQHSIVTTLDSLKSKVDRLQANYEKISQECDALKQAILRQVFE